MEDPLDGRECLRQGAGAYGNVVHTPAHVLVKDEAPVLGHGRDPEDRFDANSRCINPSPRHASATWAFRM
jgi:hypothetical protein